MRASHVKNWFAASVALICSIGNVAEAQSTSTTDPRCGQSKVLAWERATSAAVADLLRRWGGSAGFSPRTHFEPSGATTQAEISTAGMTALKHAMKQSIIGHGNANPTQDHVDQASKQINDWFDALQGAPKIRGALSNFVEVLQQDGPDTLLVVPYPNLLGQYQYTAGCSVFDVFAVGCPAGVPMSVEECTEPAIRQLLVDAMQWPETSSNWRNNQFFVLHTSSSSDTAVQELQDLYDARAKVSSTEEAELVQAFGSQWRDRIRLFAIDPSSYQNSECVIITAWNQAYCAALAARSASTSTNTSSTESTHVLINKHELAVPARRCDPCSVALPGKTAVEGVLVESQLFGSGVYQCDPAYSSTDCAQEDSKECAALLQACAIPDPVSASAP